MDKSALLDRMGVEREERLLLAKILDRAAQSQSRNIPAATDFLTPQQQYMTVSLLRLAEIPETRYIMTGGYDGAERKVSIFLPDWSDPESIQPPLRYIRASFHPDGRLTHRDILGSLMGLGIVREKVGDILITPDSADVIVAESVADFLIRNWSAAGRVSLKVEPVDAANLHFPEIRYEQIRDTVSSPRLDAVLASGLRTSRAKAAALVTAGRVQVNWRECVKPDKLLTASDIITARGFGKLELSDIGGLTRKGRVSVTLKRYR